MDQLYRTHVTKHLPYSPRHNFIGKNHHCSHKGLLVSQAMGGGGDNEDAGCDGWDGEAAQGVTDLNVCSWVSLMCSDWGLGRGKDARTSAEIQRERRADDSRSKNKPEGRDKENRVSG